jgi:hypothetical protein
MSGAPENKHIKLYRLIMTEIKERCEVLRVVSDQKVNVWPVAAYELGQLQLRLVCELIGLGCLAAHGDIPATYTKRLLTTYEPGKIFSELEKLHPNFYPRACSKDIQTVAGQTSVEVLDDHSYLGREELVIIHGKTANSLHRGHLKDIGRGFHLDFKYLEDCHNKIVDLLRVHLISLYDVNRYVLIIMSDPKTGAVGAAEISAHQKSEGWKTHEAARRSPAAKK